jgi:23S rRNA pseudouridine1911/1915/1917 synthase
MASTPSSTFFTIPDEAVISRLDKVVSAHMANISRARLQKLIKNGGVKVNEKKIDDCSFPVKAGDQIEVAAIEPQGKSSTLQAKKIDFSIVYEDEHLLVINKPAGLSVHPGAGNQDNTLVNALLYHYGNNLSSIRGRERAGIVHRLDKDTTGLMLVAKDDETHAYLSEQLENREIARTYIAFVYGCPIPPVGKITNYLTRDSKDHTKIMVAQDIIAFNEEGNICRRSMGANRKLAITNYRVLESYGNGTISMIECRLETGRTHQIRVHMAEIGHNVVGDQVYSRGFNVSNKHFSTEALNALKRFRRQALHSQSIGFVHPVTEEEMEFTSELPKDMQELIDLMRQSKRG